jgi:hypothetical protein
MKRHHLIVALSLIHLSCASALKKECKATNWFEHGQKVAMSGKRLSADDFAARCEGEGVHANSADLDLGWKSGNQNYCKPEVVYSTGRNGQFFTEEFCEPNELRRLKVRHAEGVKEYCQPENAYSVGANGVVYNNICPKEMEKNFLAKYRKGRKTFLGNEILKREKQIMDLDNDISVMDQKRRSRSTDLMMLANRGPRTELVSVTNPDGTISTQVRQVEDPAVEQQKRDAQWDINSYERKIDGARAEQKKLRTESFDLKKEQNSLEEM